MWRSVPVFACIFAERHAYQIATVGRDAASNGAVEQFQLLLVELEDDKMIGHINFPYVVADGAKNGIRSISTRHASAARMAYPVA
jgi:hypothetical protein